MRYLLALVGLLGTGPLEAQAVSHLRVATELLEVSGMRALMNASDSAYVEQLIVSAPSLGDYRDILYDWALSVYNWDRLAPLAARRLTQDFSEAELQDVVTFFKSTAGRKWVERRGGLQVYLTQLTTAAATEAWPELLRRIRVRAAELQRPMPKIN